MTVPCGQCLGCRISRREQWVARMLHEASLHEANCFVTLTYSDDHLPPGGSLRMSDWSAFLKRLRRRVEPLRISAAGMGEYGPQTLRAHYHGILFGMDFVDRKAIRRTPAGELSFVSELLTSAWGLGNCECSDLTPRSVRYVAKHNVDKLNGPAAADYYRRVDPETGEVFEVEREQMRYSCRPAIGKRWLEKFECDAIPSNFIISDGHKIAVPRYYKRHLKDRFELSGSDADRLAPVDDALVMARKAKAHAKTDQSKWNNSPERLAVREEVQVLALKRLKRDAL